MSPRVKGVLAGGALSGILGVIMGLIPIVSYLCCIVALIGGAVAGLIHVKSSDEGVSMGQGAVTGALSGLIMFLMCLFIQFPISLLILFLVGAQANVEWFLDMFRYDGPGMYIGYAINLVLGIVYCFGFGTGGGVAAAAIFEDREPGSKEKKNKPSGPVAMPQAAQAPQQMPPQQAPPAQMPPQQAPPVQTPQGPGGGPPPSY